MRSTGTGNTSHNTQCTHYIIRRMASKLIFACFFLILFLSPCSGSDGGSAPGDGLCSPDRWRRPRQLDEHRGHIPSENLDYKYNNKIKIKQKNYT